MIRYLILVINIPGAEPESFWFYDKSKADDTYDYYTGYTDAYVEFYTCHLEKAFNNKEDLGDAARLENKDS